MGSRKVAEPLTKAVFDCATGELLEGVELEREELELRKLDAAAALERAWLELRAERDRRLAACDWTQGADAPLAPAKVKAWAKYRAELRELPASTKDPSSPSWPKSPAG